MLPESIEKEKKIGRLQRENFSQSFQSRRQDCFRTDSGVYPHGDNAKQFGKMVDWGMKPNRRYPGSHHQRSRSHRRKSRRN